jgi:hypothetical protein
MARVNLVTPQSVRGGESGVLPPDAGDHLVLLAATTVAGRFIFSQSLQVLADQSRHGGVQLSRSNTSPPIQLVIHSYCDILHSFSVSFSPCGKKPSRGPLLL